MVQSPRRVLIQNADHIGCSAAGLTIPQRIDNEIVEVDRRRPQYPDVRGDGISRGQAVRVCCETGHGRQNDHTVGRTTGYTYKGKIFIDRELLHVGAGTNVDRRVGGSSVDGRLNGRKTAPGSYRCPRPRWRREGSV